MDENAGPNRDDRRKFGAYLREHRQRISPDVEKLGDYRRTRDRIGKPVTQEEFAEAVDVSRTWYSLLEAGTATASSALLGRFGDALSLSPDDRLQLFRLSIPELGKPAVPEGVFASAPSASPTGQRFSVPVVSEDEIEPAARRFAAAREAFLSTGSAVSSSSRPRILASWARCLAHHLDPNRSAAPLCAPNKDSLEERREQSGELLRVAVPVLSYVADNLADSGYAVVITDDTGCILEIRGESDVRKRLSHIDFLAGGDWSEGAAGTNAIGTAITDGRPMQLMAAEHFCEGWQDLTCTAAPIRLWRTGKVVGSLDITGRYALVRPYLLGFIMRCALEIEEALNKG